MKDKNNCTNRSREIKEVKNKKCWARTSTEGKDTHIMIGLNENKEGKHSHFISDTKTGEIRIHGDDENPNKLISKIVSVVTKQGDIITYKQDSVKTTLEFNNEDKSSNQNLPILLPSIGTKSGGPEGHIIKFNIKNISNSPAFNIHANVKGFGSEYQLNDLSELLANQENEIVYHFSSDKPFKKIIPELSICLIYEDMNGNRLTTKRELRQQLVPSEMFYDLEPSSFHQPTLISDDIIKIISEPFSNGGRSEIIFQVKVNENIRDITIGISRSLAAIFRFNDDIEIKQAIVELAERKIKKMIKDQNFYNYCFMSSDLQGLQGQFTGGIEAYFSLRNSI